MVVQNHEVLFIDTQKGVGKDMPWLAKYIPCETQRSQGEDFNQFAVRKPMYLSTVAIKSGFNHTKILETTHSAGNSNLQV